MFLRKSSRLRSFYRWSVFSERVPVHDAEETVEEREDDKLPVKEFVDAAPPSQQQVEEGPQAGVSNPARVRHRHRCCSLAHLPADCGVT